MYYFCYELLLLAGQMHHWTAFDGDSVLWPPHCTQTQRLIQRPVLHTCHIHTSNSDGEHNPLTVDRDTLALCSMLIVQFSNLQETLLFVATWLESHPKEIVILACSHFEGISDRLHQALIFSLKKLFGSKLCPETVVFSSDGWFAGCRQHNVSHYLTWPPQESVLTLRHLWASGYQVILSYDFQAAEGHPEFWPAIPYWWANQRTAQKVISYMEWKKEQGRPGWVWIYSLAHVSVTLELSHEDTKLSFFCQRASSSLVWTWQLTGITSLRIWSRPCGRWPSIIGTVWGSGWRTRDQGRTPRALTSSQETLWVHFLSAPWSSHWTKNL